MQAVLAAPVPAGATAVRVDVYPKNLELELGVSDLELLLAIV